MNTPSMSNEEFEGLNELLSSRFGLQFTEAKRELLISRLGPRLEALGLRSFMDYLLFLEFRGCLNGHGEMVELVRSITNPETYFFRDKRIFEAIVGPGLAWLHQGQVSPAGLRFLSAGCSHGEEPYTLRIFAAQAALGQAVTVDAFDLAGERVEQARLGEYGERSLRSMEPDMVQSLFKPVSPGRYRLRSLYREGVRFTQANIVDLPSYRSSLPYDAILCRNVLIYFSEGAIHRAIANFASILRPGGLLFLGHGESIIGLTECFEAVLLGDCVAYRRMPSHS